MTTSEFRTRTSLKFWTTSDIKDSHACVHWSRMGFAISKQIHALSSLQLADSVTTHCSELHIGLWYGRILCWPSPLILLCQPAIDKLCKYPLLCSRVCQYSVSWLIFTQTNNQVRSHPAKVLHNRSGYSYVSMAIASKTHNRHAVQSIHQNRHPS